MQKQASTPVRQRQDVRVATGEAGDSRGRERPCLDPDQHKCQPSETLALSQAEWEERFEYSLAPVMERRFAEYKPSDWRRQRRIAASMPKRARMDLCGKRRMSFRCGCRTVNVAVGCGQRWLCAVCRKKWTARLRRKLLRAVKHKRGRWVLVTMTLRHSGDPTRDAKRLKESWARLRVWLHSRMGKFDYVAVAEATPGRDAKGHIHLHVLARWQWIDWAHVHRAWLRASRGESSNIDIKLASKGGRGGAIYVSKYASKGCDVSGFPPELAARVLGAMYMRRMVTCSRTFWVPEPRECRSCLEPHVLIERPVALGDADVRFLSYYLLGPPGGGPAPPAWKQGSLWRLSQARSSSQYSPPRG